MGERHQNSTLNLYTRAHTCACMLTHACTTHIQYHIYHEIYIQSGTHMHTYQLEENSSATSYTWMFKGYLNIPQYTVPWAWERANPLFPANPWTPDLDSDHLGQWQSWETQGGSCDWRQVLSDGSGKQTWISQAWLLRAELGQTKGMWRVGLGSWVPMFLPDCWKSRVWISRNYDFFHSLKMFKQSDVQFLQRLWRGRLLFG